MAAKSKHWGDVYNWIIDVIDSCKTIRQLNSTDKVIANFERTYPYIPDNLIDLLFEHRNNRRYDVKIF